MQFLYDEHNDSWPMFFPISEALRAHRNVQVLGGWVFRHMRRF